MTMGDTRDRNPELQGVGGWLAFLCVSLLLFAPLSAVREIGTTLMDQTMEPYDKALMVALTIAAAGFAVFTGLGLVQVWRKALLIAKVYYFVNLALGLLIGLGALLAEGTAEDAALSVSLTLVSAAWLAYLYRSERVRNTYGKNTVRDAAEVFR